MHYRIVFIIVATFFMAHLHHIYTDSKAKKSLEDVYDWSVY